MNIKVQACSLVISLRATFFITFTNYSAGALRTTIYSERGLRETQKKKSNDSTKSRKILFKSYRESQRKILARLLNNSEITQPLNMI